MRLGRRVVSVMILLGLCGTAFSQESLWPDLSEPPAAMGGGEHDAAVVVGVEGYAFVGQVPGAELNAKQWYKYLTRTRGVPAQNVKLLTGVDGTRERILEGARLAADRVGEGGTLWFVFVGHGAPSSDGKDGLLVGVDAQQTAESLQERSVKRGEILTALEKSQARAIPVVLDACFSGRRPDGSNLVPGLQPLMTVTAAVGLDPRAVVLTAAKGDEFAGALPGGNRPAFSYLVLGGLRGWAGEGKRSALTAGDLRRYAANALDATLRGRKQTPDMMGKEDLVMGGSSGEKGPDLARIAEATAGLGAQTEMFKISSLPSVPKAAAPAAMADAGEGADFRNVDIRAMKKLNAATLFDKGEASPQDKAQKWSDLAKEAPKFAEKANVRAAQWRSYAQELAAQEEARAKVEEAMSADWEKLSELLPLEIVPLQDKKRWAMMFVKAYGKTSTVNPYVGELSKYLPAGTVKTVPGAKAAAARRGKAGEVWVTLPGGSFMMGSENGESDEKPRHPVTIKSFQMMKTLATFGQYKKCVEAGACTAAHVSDGSCKVWNGSQWAPGILPDSFQGDDQPVVCVDWDQAKVFSEWLGGRLPSEAEWQYAARSAGKEYRYPWGNQDPSCERAVITDGSAGGQGCGRYATWPVCSKPRGNTEQGLCDMLGNAWEWVQDWYHGSYDAAPIDGSAWESPAGEQRVRLGNCWADGGHLQVTYRSNRAPGDCWDFIGFRPARELRD